MGLSISIASTVVLLRNLMDSNLLHTSHGQLAVAWLIMEDIATVLILVLLPAFSATGEDSLFLNGFTAISKAIAFCDAGEMDYLKDIQILIGKKIPVIHEHPFPLQNTKVEKVKQKQRRPQGPSASNNYTSSNKDRKQRSYSRP